MKKMRRIELVLAWSLLMNMCTAGSGGITHWSLRRSLGSYRSVIG